MEKIQNGQALNHIADGGKYLLLFLKYREVKISMKIFFIGLVIPPSLYYKYKIILLIFCYILLVFFINCTFIKSIY